MNDLRLFKIIPFSILIVLFSGILIARDFPEKPFPPRLVNDFTGLLNTQEINALENKLVAFNDSTSTQIAIVTVEDLMGYDKADYAQRLAQMWGIGQKGRDNGILILVKPKTGKSQGQVFIAQGYGLEGVIPDITCGEIVDYEILPAFRANDYYGGLDKATNTLMALASGEFSADQYGGKNKEDFGAFSPFIFFIIFLIIIMFFRSKGGKNQRHISDKGLPLWLLLSMMNSGRGSHKGSWGGFSGGGGGGFGGFGGGSFGGGGAGGSW
ncbi:MAG: phosphatase protein [Bacteroidota bacterium]|nr:phosphatase protein [Bacteroidota bacterium]